MSNHSPEYELLTRSTINTQTFLETCVFDANYKALEEHLVSNPVQQNDLDICLLRGLQVVQRKERDLSHMALVLILLVQSGAKWNSDALLDDQKTPLHIICDSHGDNHELLDLMIKSSQPTIINTRDTDSHTALMYAVKYANINCLKCLITNDADVTIGQEDNTKLISVMYQPLTPITAAIWMLTNNSEYSYDIMSDIFDLLLDTAVKKNNDFFRSCPDYLISALNTRNFTCLMKLITMGAPLDAIAYRDRYVWELAASKGNVEMLKCMLNHGVDKNTTNHNGGSLLWFVVLSGKIEAVHYLLDLGVDTPTFTHTVQEIHCEQCKEIRLNIECDSTREYQDPCLTALRDNRFEIVKLLDDYGSKSYQSFCTLRYAIQYCGVDMISYLLNKYTYSINMEYSLNNCDKDIFTLLTDPSSELTVQITKLLLDHGADPAKSMCSATSANALMAAMFHNAHLNVIVQYIRSGVDLNFRSWAYQYGNVSPFELSVLLKRHYVSVLLLISGCSRGVFSTHKLKAEPELEKLMKEWNVYDDNVTPLKQRCRSVILNHLFPRADNKIGKLPLPTCLIKFLSVPELDDMLFDYNHKQPYTRFF